MTKTSACRRSVGGSFSWISDVRKRRKLGCGVRSCSKRPMWDGLSHFMTARTTSSKLADDTNSAGRIPVALYIAVRMSLSSRSSNGLGCECEDS